MKAKLSNSLGIVLISSVSAFASTGAESVENGWVWMLFLGFAAVIVVFQLVPAMILMGAMLKGLFSSADATNPTSESNGTKSS